MGLGWVGTIKKREVFAAFCGAAALCGLLRRVGP